MTHLDYDGRKWVLLSDYEELRAKLAVYEKCCECCGAAIRRVEFGRVTCVQGCSYPAETT